MKSQVASVGSVLRGLCARIRSVRMSCKADLVDHSGHGVMFEPLENRILLDATILGQTDYDWVIEPHMVQVYQRPSNNGDEWHDSWWDFNTLNGLKPEMPQIDIQQQNAQQIAGTVFIPGLMHTEQQVDGVNFNLFEMPGEMFSGNVGQAQLPTINNFFIVPENVDVSWSITPTLVMDLGDQFTIMPLQPGHSESYEGDLELKMDMQYYSGQTQGEATCRLLEPFTIRGYEIIGTEISPLIYDPATGHVQVVAEFSFTIDFSGRDGIDLPKVDSRLASPFYDALVSSFVDNPVSHDIQYIHHHQTDTNGADYLIITADAFYDEVLPLAQWKQQKGLLTQVTCMSDIGSSSTDVADYIQNAYDNWTIAPSHVLLVGDYNDVPSNNLGYMADNVYACVDGADYLPDLTIGRLSVHTETEAADVVSKILAYDKTPSSDDWYDDVLIAAYLQGPPEADRFFMETAMHAYQYMQEEQGLDMHAALTTDSLGASYYYRADSPSWYPHRLDIVSRYEPFASSQYSPYPVPTWISDMVHPDLA